MTFLATTRASVLRGTTTDALGDEVDANGGSPVAGYDDLIASIVERRTSVYDPASGTRRTVRFYSCRLPYFVVLAEGDRIKDNNTGEIFAITEKVTVPRSLAGQSSLTLKLTKTGEA